MHFLLNNNLILSLLVIMYYYYIVVILFISLSILSWGLPASVLILGLQSEMFSITFIIICKFVYNLKLVSNAFSFIILLFPCRVIPLHTSSTGSRVYCAALIAP